MHLAGKTALITGGARGMGRVSAIELARMGARTHIYVASSPAVEGVSGRYFAYCKEAQPSLLAQDAAIRKRLWAWTAQVTGVGG